MSKALGRGAVAWRTGKAFCLAATLTGCSVFNPHIGLPNPPQRYQGQGFVGDLPRAIDDANQLRTAYYDAVGDQAKLRNGLALTLIPLSATALFYGITSPSSRGTKDFITGTVVGGGAAYGLGTLFLSDSKQAVYLAGSRALGCAVMAMRPYLIPQAQFEALQKQTAALGDAAEAVRTDIADVEGLIGAGGTTADTTAILAGAREQLRRAETTRQAAHLVIGRVLSAGIVLDTAVANIRDKVSEQILTTEPNLQAVMAVNSGLRQLGGQVMPSQLSAALPSASTNLWESQGKPRETPFAEAMARLKTDLKTLAAANALVATGVETTTAMERVAGDPMACEPANAAHRIELVPPAEKVALGPSQKYQITVLGGTGIPRASVSGANAADIDVQTKLQNGAYVVEVAVAAKPQPGERLLVIADASGHGQKIVTLDIGGAASAPKTARQPVKRQRVDPPDPGKPPVVPTPPPPVQPPNAPPQPPSAAKLDPAQVTEIQRKFRPDDPKPSGVWDADTVTIVKSWQTLCKLSPADGFLTTEQAKHVNTPDFTPKKCPGK